MSFAEDVRRKLRAKAPRAEKEARRARRRRLRIGRVERPLRVPQPPPLLDRLKRILRREPPSKPAVSTPLVSSYAVVERAGGFTFAYDPDSRTVHVWLKTKDVRGLGRWGFLKPLIENPSVQEVHVRGRSVAVFHARLGRFNVRYVDLEVTDAMAAKLVSNLSAYARAAVDFETPAGYGELDGWRVYVKLDVVSGAPELVATRIIEIPDITEWLSPDAAAKVLTLALLPHATVIFGPPGSGKTTFLNSLLLKVHELFPWLSISVVETVPELVLPSSPSIHRTAPMLAEGRLSVSEAVSRAFRFERPNVLVLGELRGDELRSWQEVARAGIPALTTVHAPSLERCVSTLTSLLEAAGVPLRLTDHFRVFVEIRRIETERGFVRSVGAVYFYAGGEPVAVYGEGAVDEEGFLGLISGRRSFLGDAERFYERVRAFLGA